MANRKMNYMEVEGVELDGRRKDLFEIMRDKFPEGNQKTQKYFCLSIAEERVEVYLKDFSRV